MAKSSTARKENPDHAKNMAEHLGPGPSTGIKYIPEGFRRKNLIMTADHMYKLKCLAYWEGVTEYEANYLIYEEFFKNRKMKEMPSKKEVIPNKKFVK